MMLTWRKGSMRFMTRMVRSKSQVVKAMPAKTSMPKPTPEKPWVKAPKLTNPKNSHRYCSANINNPARKSRPLTPQVNKKALF